MGRPFRFLSRSTPRQTSRNRTKRAYTLEPLEPRLVLDSTVVFNEIMYHPPGENEALEWIELHNQMGVNMDISGWRVADGVDFQFPEGSILPGDGQVVIAADPAALQAATGFAPAMGPYTGRLANNGERLELRNNSDRVVDSMQYNDVAPWAVGPDGSGATLAKRNPSSASAPAENWTVSQQVGGTPGAENFPTGQKQLTLPNVFGTGIGADGSFLPAGQPDPHWVVAGEGQPATAMTPGPDWASSDDAHWIGMTATADQVAPNGLVTYSTSFDLDGFDPATAKLTLNLVAADQVVDVTFNGASLGISSLGFQKLPRRSQDITDGFLPGTNTLEVVTRNIGGPSGALVLLSGTAVTLPLPEDSLEGLMFNEVAGAEDAGMFVELANRSGGTIDLTGMQIRSSGGASATLAAGQLQAGQYLAVAADQLGFTPAAGESLFLVTASGDRVIDGARVRNSLEGRSEAHDLRWLNPDVPTPGAANSFAINNNVVINEVMYHGPTTPRIQGMPPQFAETALVPIDATWRRSKDFNFGPADLPLDPGPDWAAEAHQVDGVNWLEGQAPVGVGRVVRGTPRIATKMTDPKLVSNFITTYYFETEFGLTQQQIDEMDELQLTHVVDDGAVFYINGVEVDRFNMPEGSVQFDTLAATSVDRAGLSEGQTIPKDMLVALPATNRISVELHQAATDSDDAVFAAELVGRDLVDPGFPTQPPVDSTEEWIELLNRSDTEVVDLTGWQFSDGISYRFEDGMTIQPGQYLVVAGDPTAVLAQHPSLDPTTVLGPFTGSLSDRGERIELSDANNNPADEVRYFERGHWPSAADGGGSSLELRDPDMDNSAPEAWAASDETGRSHWQTYSYRATGENPIPNDPSQYSEFLFGLLEEGEMLIDDIGVIQNPGTADAQPLIQNGSFDTDSIGGQPAAWRIIGNQHGTVVADPDDPANHVLHLRAAGPTEHVHNNAGTTLKAGDELVRRIDANAEYEISFRAKWLSGSNQLNTRMYFNRAPRKTLLEMPGVHGTPGMPNSMQEENAGPTYEGLRHGPVVPNAGQDVTVSVAAADPDGVAAMTLWYSVNSGEFSSVAMTRAGNGQYVGLVPGQDAKSVVQFYVQGQDALGAASMFPARGPESRALYQVQDDRSNFDTGVHNFRIVMTPADSDFLHEPTNVMSNDPMGTTIIYDEQEVFYDATLRLKGSERGRNQGVRVGFLVKFDPMQPFRGVQETMAVDRSGAGNEFSQKEILVKQGIHHAGDIPGTYDDLIHVITPRDRQTGSALLMTGFRDYFLDTAYENGSDGTMFEYELIYYPTTTVGRDPEGLKLPEPDNVVGAAMADHGDNQEAYRWHWLIKNNRDADDYSQMITALKALGQRAGDQFHQDTDRLLDVDNWLRSFAVQVLYGIGDNYATNSGPWHNAFFYARPDGKTLYFPYDMDFTFSQGATSGIVSNTELRKLVDDPGNEHMYMGHLDDIINTTFNNEYMDQWIDHYQSKLTSRQSFASFKRYISQRHDSVLGRLPDQVAFEITTAGPLDVGDASTAQIQGNGWVNVREIRIAGRQQPLNVTWSNDATTGDPTVWQATLPVNNATPSVTLEAYDFQHNLIGTTSIDVISTAANPVADSLRVTEINYNPYDPTPDEVAANAMLGNDDFEFIEVQNVGQETINLLGTRLTDGVDFTFPAVSLQPGEYGVVVKNLDAFQLRYGEGVNVIGVFDDGGLSNRGERLTLVDSADATILDFRFGDNDPWPESADGVGATLQLVDPAGTAPGQFDRYDAWRSSTEMGGSPGTAGAAPVGVVINEVLTNTDQPDTQTDAIELHNTTDEPIDMGGWYLSDSANDLLKFQLPAGTTIGPRGYLVVDESSFNPNPSNPGPNDFALSGARGDDVWLVIADGAGGIASLVDEVHFGAAGSGESWGRVPDGTGRLAPMARVTLGGENSPARVGPVIISEITYHPAAPTAAALAVDPELTADDLELIEIYNPTAAAVDLTHWQITGGVDFEFPAGLQLAPSQAAVLVSFDPADADNANRLAALRTQYGIDETVVLVGGYRGRLDDDGEMVRLMRPDAATAEEPDPAARLLEDEVIYDDVAPWPAEANGTGRSLTRTNVDALGNLAGSWSAELPSPGTTDFSTVLPGDANGDGQFDQNDLESVLAAGKYMTGQPASFEQGDFNGDGLFNQLDLVAALQAGGFPETAAAALAVPQAEPTVDGLDNWFARFGQN